MHALGFGAKGKHCKESRSDNSGTSLKSSARNALMTELKERMRFLSQLMNRVEHFKKIKLRPRTNLSHPIPRAGLLSQYLIVIRCLYKYSAVCKSLKYIYLVSLAENACGQQARSLWVVSKWRAFKNYLSPLPHERILKNFLDCYFHRLNCV